MTFLAPLVISDAGAATTYGRLLPAALRLPEQAAIAAAQPPPSALTLYLGLKESPAALGLHGANHWIYNGLDHAALARAQGAALEGRPPFAFLSFGSLRDPHATRHTAQIITWASADDFAAWRDQPWRRRGDDYAVLKQRIAEGLLDLVEAHYPGFRRLVDYQELSTPLSIETFTGHAGGAIYGIPATPERLRRGLFAIRTPVPGLLLTGSDVLSAGVVGAMMGGVLTSAAVLGPMGYPTIIRAARAFTRTAHPRGDEQNFTACTRPAAGR